jgi:hypothetical protein
MSDHYSPHGLSPHSRPKHGVVESRVPVTERDNGTSSQGQQGQSGRSS